MCNQFCMMAVLISQSIRDLGLHESHAWAKARRARTLLYFPQLRAHTYIEKYYRACESLFNSLVVYWHLNNTSVCGKLYWMATRSQFPVGHISNCLLTVNQVPSGRILNFLRACLTCKMLFEFQSLSIGFNYGLCRQETIGIATANADIGQRLV